MRVRPRLIVAMTVAALAFLGGGCSPKPPSSRPPVSTASATVPAALETMPDAAGQRVQDVGARLTEAGLHVVVVIPERRLVADAAGRAARHDTGPTSPLTLPEKAAPFGGQYGWAQVVATQTPAPGARLSTDDTVTLVAGRHAGGDLTRPWVWEHVYSIQKSGANPCFDCHQESFCEACHTKMLKGGG